MFKVVPHSFYFRALLNFFFFFHHNFLDFWYFLLLAVQPKDATDCNLHRWEILEKCRLFIPWLWLLDAVRMNLFLFIFLVVFFKRHDSAHGVLACRLGGGVPVRPIWVLNITWVESHFWIIHLYIYIYIHIYLYRACIYIHTQWTGSTPTLHTEVWLVLAYFWNGLLMVIAFR